MVVLGEVAPGKRLVIWGIQLEFHGCMFFLVGSFNESLFLCGGARRPDLFPEADLGEGDPLRNGPWRP